MFSRQSKEYGGLLKKEPPEDPRLWSFIPFYPFSIEFLWAQIWDETKTSPLSFAASAEQLRHNAQGHEPEVMMEGEGPALRLVGFRRWPDVFLILVFPPKMFKIAKVETFLKEGSQGTVAMATWMWTWNKTWLWVKKTCGDHRFWSIFPFTKPVFFRYPVFLTYTHLDFVHLISFGVSSRSVSDVRVPWHWCHRSKVLESSTFVGKSPTTGAWKLGL